MITIIIPISEVDEKGERITGRFNSAKNVPQTRQYHYFKPIDCETMKVKIYSFEVKDLEVKMIKTIDNVNATSAKPNKKSIAANNNKKKEQRRSKKLK